MSCQIKMGLFVLRECGEPPKSLCFNCNLSICKKHTRQTENGDLCPECYMQLNPENPESQGYNQYLAGENREYNPGYYFHMRNEFQKKTNFRPYSDPDYGEFKTDITKREFRDENIAGRRSLDS